MLLCRPLESAVFMPCSAQRTRSPVFFCGGWAAMAESPHLPNAAFTILLLCLKEQLVTCGHLTGSSRLTCWAQPVQSSCPLLSVTAVSARAYQLLLGVNFRCWLCFASTAQHILNSMWELLVPWGSPSKTQTSVSTCMFITYKISHLPGLLTEQRQHLW